MSRIHLSLLVIAILLQSRAFGDPPVASDEKPAVEAPTEKGVKEPAFGLHLAHRPAESRILTALATRDNFRYSKLSLSKLAEDIERRFDIEVQIDSRALNDVSIPESLEVSIDLHDVALVSALNAVLRFDKLRWAIWDESLWITTESEADQHLTVIIYDVADLGTADGDETSVDFESLTDLVTTTIAPHSWDTVGGPGSIAPFSCAGVSVLAVSQTWPVHLQIGKLLTNLRTVKKNGTSSKRAGPSEKTGKLSENSSEPLAREKGRDAQSKPAESAVSTALVQGNNQFAFDLYQKLREDRAEEADANLFFSPYSISTAIGMAYAGGQGKTAEEIAQVLHFDASPDELAREFSRLNNRVNPSTLTVDKLRLANRLWGDERLPIERPFLESIKQGYNGDLESVDFRRPAIVVARVNQWVSEQTEGMIQQILDAGSLNAEMPLVLVNAIYFHGKWKTPFSPDATRPGDFHGFKRRQSVPLMHAQIELNYCSDGSLQMIELPYRDSQMAMLVLLPREGRTQFAELEKQLAEKLDVLLSRLKQRQVSVTLPKFTVEQGFDLEQPLASLGMKRPFDQGLAEFGGITARPLWIAALVHQAKVEVDEQGTRAAAVTGGAFGGTVPRLTLFQADRPFVFMIRHQPTGQIVFLGRLMQPVEERD
jgi:serpin B